MKKLLLFGACLLSMHASMAEVASVTINDTEYPVKTLIDRQIGPGVQYTRIRLSTFPLNVNMLKIDLTNPYNTMETTQASEALFKTEHLVTAAKRQSREGHMALAGANANFWCVPTQEPYSDLLLGMTFNGNMRNGKIITETNCRADQWDGGPNHTGIFALTEDKIAYSGNKFTWEGYIDCDRFPSPVEVAQTNKIVREDEICIYNSFFGSDRKFLPADQEYNSNDGKVHFLRHENVTTEVLLTMNEGSKWNSGETMEFTVKEVRLGAGNGTLGANDLAICGRGNKLPYLNMLQPGDKVRLAYFWRSGSGELMHFTNLVGGNAQVMVDGKLTKYNESENYNSMVYSRTGYGTSADGKTAYIIVIDKASSIWGNSIGCKTSVMCEIAKAYGCVNLTNFDAGGSAQMLVGGKIINTTTESSPRAVANGMLIYSTAPTDKEVASLEFYDLNLEMPRYSTFAPRIIAYNQYGDIISDDFKDFTLSCPEINGTCSGNEIFVSGVSGEFPLTATCGSVSVTKTVNVVDSEIIVRIPDLLIDAAHPYTMEVTAKIGQNIFVYDPSKIEWTTDDSTVATIDANGVLTGVGEGKTVITGVIGDFETKSNVTVEIADAPVMHLDNWANFTAAGTSGCAVKDFADGVISFTYGSPRNPSITIRNEVDDFYSIPEAIAVEFESTATISEVAISPLTPVTTQPNVISYKPDQVYAAGTTHRVVIPVSDICDDATDLINYPIGFDFIRFTPEKTSANKGDHTIVVKDVCAEYKAFDSVNDITVAQGSGIAIGISQNADRMVVTATSPIRSVAVYGIDGRMASAATASGAQAVSVKAPARNGIYLVQVTTAAGTAVRKILVK